MRRLYTFLLTLFLPFIFFRFLWKGIRNPAYRKRWRERRGIVPFAKLSKSIWLHAVSLGEVNAALPLIKMLQSRYPHLPLVVTTATPSGSMQVLKRLPNIHHTYIPIDHPHFINRFLAHIHPELCILMETELWPNLAFCCYKKHVPVFIANARLSLQSLRGYSKIKKWLRSVWPCIGIIGVQTKLDLTRFSQIGVPSSKLKLLGNLKFEMPIPKDVNAAALKLRQQIGKDRLIWVVASTHEGEEKIILTAFHLILKRYPDLLLVLVPRHLPRFDAVANLIRQENFNYLRRSAMDHAKISSTVQVLLVDVFGELLSFYAISNLAFVAGSLVYKGGHNLLEPAAFAKPVLSGSGLENFLFIRDLFLQKNALGIADKPNDIAELVISYLKDPQKMKEKGKLAETIFKENQGALQNHLGVIDEYIKPKKNASSI
jgi:3-deoxy-D-manno-octulosonic-acid transferase